MGRKVTSEQREVLTRMRDGAFIAMGIFSERYKLWGRVGDCGWAELRAVAPEDVGQMNREGWIAENPNNATEHRITRAGRRVLLSRLARLLKRDDNGTR